MEVLTLSIGWEMKAWYSGNSNLRESLTAEPQILPSLSHPQVWGLQMIYKSVNLPALKVRSMLLQTPEGRIHAKKWSRVPFPVADFDILQDSTQSLSDLSLD
jgi:hypothetical protein